MPESLFGFSAGGFSAEFVADGHEQAGGGRAVVGADKVNVAQPVVGFVVRDQDDSAGLFAGEAHDEVAHGHGTDGRIGGEGVLFDCIAMEVRAQKLFCLDVSRTRGPARADGCKLARVAVGARAVEMLLGTGGQRRRGQRAAGCGFQ